MIIIIKIIIIIIMIIVIIIIIIITYNNNDNNNNINNGSNSIAKVIECHIDIVMNLHIYAVSKKGVSCKKIAFLFSCS